eukprot:TRINITY_DN5770_c0_g1_i1.p1 TRINITY_DN5770_c0_g1~~TRINITY_DN5770_c0_g1_i1.p1  ORF type:complete len:148 (+),score=21.80 TRINITY_DN5770_c0_g1_i1:233-676(+)
MFNFFEFTQILSGVESEIDVDDWQKHTKYDGYTRHSGAVRDFWSVVKKLSNEDRKKVLRFATSTSRPPLQGFKHMQPPFTIRWVPSDNGLGIGRKVKAFFSSKPTKDPLPSSSTCFNMLKLPQYPTKRALREKLLHAVNTSTGFYLT